MSDEPSASPVGLAQLGGTSGLVTKKEWVRELQPRGFAELTPQQYVSERLNPELGYYNRAAGRYKKRYLGMRAVTVIGGAIVPVLINLPDHPTYPVKTYITTLLSLLVVLFVSLESVLHYREQWTNYRSTEQNLLNEYFSFTARSGAYAEVDGNAAYRLFVDRVEKSIEAESASTLRVLTTVTDGKPSNISDGRREGELSGSTKVAAARVTTETVVAETVAVKAVPAENLTERVVAEKAVAEAAAVEKVSAEKTAAAKGPVEAPIAPDKTHANTKPAVG